MLLLLLFSIRAESCDIQNYSTATCGTIRDFYALNISGQLEVLRLRSCPPDNHLVSSKLSVLKLECNDSQLPLFFLSELPALKEILVSSCEVSVIPWQSVYISSPISIPSLNVSQCPLDCSCPNLWLSSSMIGLTSPTRSILPPLSITLPSQYHCAPNCTWGRLQSPSSVDVRVGERIHIDIKIIGVTGVVIENRKYFKWHLWSEEHHFTEIISTNRLQLLVENATSDVLGTVFVVCWHCQQPLHTKIEIRILSSLRATLEELDDSEVLVVSGYPLDDLNLTISKADGTETTEETHSLQDREQTKYWNSLIVRPDPGHSQFHRRIFSVYTLACSACPVDHLAGNYTFTVCSPTNCFSVHNYIDHLGNQSEVNLHEAVFPSKHSILFWVYTLSLTTTIILTLCSLLVLRLRLVQRCYLKLLVLRKRTWSDQVDSSRRASRATEETLLRLEERSSLSSSDYSGQIIPFIQMGNIKIHERIGKGAFGEVYCGSWEKIGARSVAVKTIPEADEDVEKEAIVLSRLDHPNIVRLYGMTRDGSRLLLVFEMMNLGDLRSFLRARAPQASNYSQFPPALVESELKNIIREIVKGVCYLVAQQVVHRDLAARNCLVQGESDLRCCLPSQRPPIRVKISDFGMSRRLYGQCDYYKMQRHSLLPVRWLPPEAINDHKFSYMSDIWSLGVTMWEVFSYGQIPFAELTNHEMVSYAMAGMRPPRPRFCPQGAYDLMQKCWASEPDKRVTAEDILLDPCLETQTNDNPVE